MTKSLCRGICTRLELIPAMRNYPTTPNGCYCTKCMIAFVNPSSRCPCCKNIVRRKSHHNHVDRRVWID